MVFATATQARHPHAQVTFGDSQRFGALRPYYTVDRGGKVKDGGQTLSERIRRRERRRWRAMTAMDEEPPGTADWF